MFDWMHGLMSNLSEIRQYTAAIVALVFLVGLILMVKKHEKKYKRN